MHLSAKLHEARRGGSFSPYTMVPGVDTVAVPEFDRDLPGHSHLSQAHLPDGRLTWWDRGPVCGRPLSREAFRMDPSARTFATTHWSIVLATRRSDDAGASVALESLCRSYWYPLYFYVRRRGRSPEDAQDLTQQFFAHVLTRRYLQLADPARGRFRTFLLRALDHFLINDWKHGRRLKRGGGALHLSLDLERAEDRYRHEPVASLTPEQAYEKRWALTLLDRVMAELRQEYLETGRSAVFEVLAERLWGKDGSDSFLELGKRLGLSEGAARSAMHRLRERYRERLRAAVTETVADPAELEAELQHLLSVVSRTG